MTLDGNRSLLDPNPEMGSKSMAELQIINKMTFELIQKIQNGNTSRYEKQTAFENGSH